MTTKKIVPDGGWGWMIVLGVAITNMVNQALFTQFGLIYGEKIIEMGEGIIGAAWIVNLSSMITSFSGLITGPVLTKFSVRQTTIMGVLLTAIGMMLSGLATNLFQLILTLSVCIGIGLGLIISATFVVVDAYFSKRKSQAVGFSIAGTGVGQMLMPQIVRYLFDNYGYRNTTFLLGAFCLNGIPAALLFQPVKSHMKVAPEEKRPLLEKEIKIHVEDREILDPGEHRHSLLQKICLFFHLDLLKDARFIHLTVCLATVHACNVAFGMILPFFLREKVRLDFATTATVMSLLSAADLLSRFTLPLITTPCKIGCFKTFLITASGLSIFRCILALQMKLEIIFIMAVLCGYARAGIAINQNLSVSEYFPKKDKLPAAIGLNMVAKGITVLMLGPFFGWVRDYYESFVVCINAQSITIAVVVVSWCLVAVWRRF